MNEYRLAECERARQIIARVCVVSPWVCVCECVARVASHYRTMPNAAALISANRNNTLGRIRDVHASIN